MIPGLLSGVSTAGSMTGMATQAAESAAVMELSSAIETWLKGIEAQNAINKLGWQAAVSAIG
jgi:hypothetical protein